MILPEKILDVKFASVKKYEGKGPWFCLVGKNTVFPCDNKKDASRNARLINDSLNDFLIERLGGALFKYGDGGDG